MPSPGLPSESNNDTMDSTPRSVHQRRGEAGGHLADHRRRDAPDRDRPYLVLSPWVWGAVAGALGAILLGLVVRGIWGGLAAIAAVGIAATSAPQWSRDSLVEKSESNWIARRLETYHRRLEDRTAHERAMIDDFENPSKAELTIHKAGYVLAWIGIAGIVLSLDRPDRQLAQYISGAVFMTGFAMTGPRYRKRTRLQRLAAEPRGGIRTVTLRDIIKFIEHWPNRFPLFLASSALAIVAAILLI